MLRLLCFLCILSQLSYSIFAVRCYVDGTTGNDLGNLCTVAARPCKTINAAIDFFQCTDIRVDTDVRVTSTIVINGGRTVAIHGASGAISVSKQFTDGPLFFISDTDTTVEIYFMSFMNAEWNNPNGLGGVLFQVVDNSNLYLHQSIIQYILTTCNIRGGEAFGGAIAADGANSLIVSQCRISELVSVLDGECLNGVGTFIYAKDTNVTLDNFSLDNCTLQDNSVRSSPRKGGCVHIESADEGERHSLFMEKVYVTGENCHISTNDIYGTFLSLEGNVDCEMVRTRMDGYTATSNAIGSSHELRGGNIFAQTTSHENSLILNNTIVTGFRTRDPFYFNVKGNEIYVNSTRLVLINETDVCTQSQNSDLSDLIYIVGDATINCDNLNQETRGCERTRSNIINDDEADFPSDCILSNQVEPEVPPYQPPLFPGGGSVCSSYVLAHSQINRLVNGTALRYTIYPINVTHDLVVQCTHFPPRK